MPAAVAFLAAGAGGIAAGASIGAVIAFQATAMVVMNAISRKLTDRKSPSGTPTNNEREITVRATDAYEPFIYGRSMAHGLTVYHNAVAAEMNQRMFHVVKWAGHRVNCIEHFRLDDRNLLPGIAGGNIQWDPVAYVGSGFVQQGDFRGYDVNGVQLTVGETPTRMRWYTGNQTSADWVMVGALNGDWKSTSVGRERAYGVLEISQINVADTTDRVFERGFPTNIAAYVHGKSVYDHRRYALNGEPTFGSVDSYWGYSGGIGNYSGWVAGASSWHLITGVGGTTDRAAQVTSAGISAVNALRLFTEGLVVHPDSAYTAIFRLRQTTDAKLSLIASFWEDSGVTSLTATQFTIAQPTTVWSTYTYTFGAGTARTIPSSARLMRIGVNYPLSASTPSVVQAQEIAVYLGTTSRHLVDVSSTWEFSQNPPFCGADYLRNEQFGFGKESRQPVNASRYALNEDPSFRRYQTELTTSYWRTGVESGNFGVMPSSLAPFSLMLTGMPVGLDEAPEGRRIVTMVTSAGSPADVGQRLHSNWVPVDPSGCYVGAVQGYKSGIRDSAATIVWLTSDGAYITENVITSTLTSAWSRYVTAFGSGTGAAIPSSARYASLKIYPPYSGSAGGGGTRSFFQNFMLQVGTTIKQFVEPWEQIDWASVSSAADWCDTLVATPSGWQARFTCNGQGHTGKSYRDNLRDILGSGNVRYTYTMSGWRFFAGYQEPSVTVNAADIVGPIEMRGAADTNDRYNAVRGLIYDRHQDGKQVPSATVTAAEYRARDNSMQLFEDMELPFTHDWYEAQRVQFGLLEQGDNQMIGKIPVGNIGLGLQVGRHVNVRLDVMSWSPRAFLMTQVDYTTGRGAVLSVREDYAASYVDPSTTDYIARTGLSISSSTPFVAQVGSVVARARVGAIDLTWVNPSNRTFEWIDIYADNDSNLGGGALIKSTRNNVFTHMIAPNSRQYYWFRTRDFAGNVSSYYPGATSSITAVALQPIAYDPEYVYLEEFNYQDTNHFDDMWESVAGSSTLLSFPSSGIYGGKVLQLQSGNLWRSSKARIPFDPEAMYKMSVKVRTTVRSGDALQYFGLTAFRADGIMVSVDSTIGTYANQHYIAASGLANQSLGLWDEYVGYVQGHMAYASSGTAQLNISSRPYNLCRDPAQAARMHAHTRYVAPMFALNYNTGKGTMEVDYIKMEKLRTTTGLVYDRYIKNSSGWAGGYAFNDPTSYDFLSAYLSNSLVGGSDVSLAGRYGVLHCNVISKALGGFFYAYHEKLRLDYHTRFAEVGCMTITALADVYVSSTAAGNQQANMTAYVVTKNGSMAARAASATTSSLGKGVWQTIQGLITFPNSSIDTTSYSGPYYIVPGIAFGQSDAPGSYALHTLNMDRVG